jgi:hypothetical protein
LRSAWCVCMSKKYSWMKGRKSLRKIYYTVARCLPDCGNITPTKWLQVDCR